MKTKKHLPSMLSIVFVLASINLSVLGQSNDEKNFATVNSAGSSVRFDVAAPHAAVTLTVIGPDGLAFSKEFKSGNSPEFKLTSKDERLPDGQYTYELRVTPIISSETKEALKAARENGNAAEVQREMRKRGALPAQALVQSGSFMISGGSVILPGGTEEGRGSRAMAAPPVTPTVAPAVNAPVSSGRTNFKVVRHHPRFMVFDQVIPDDLIVQSSICAGFDCVDGENFGTDTIRLKENNTRLQFDDTSSSAGFPTNNWQIRANNQNSAGDFLAFVDQGATGSGETGTIVFAVDAGVSANSLRVASNSKVGFRTATPLLDMHANTNDTPAIRLEQNNTGGFTAQTWDVAGNEANFFVRDITGGSRLPFRIRPGAPTSSIDIAASGNVGIATANPGASLDVSGNTLLLGSDNNATTRTTNTTKTSRLTAPPFVSGNLNFAYAGAVTTSSDNVAGIGGALSGFSAATVVVFHTAANTNTDTGSERMRITSAGRVGINTTAPDQFLSVNGDASKGGGGSWQTFSDERLKKINGSFDTGLKAVMRLQPLRYEYKRDNAMRLELVGERIGFGAQAVQQVIPEAITKNAQGYLMVNNDPIIWTMLNAIKEQQKEIVELKRQIRQLRVTRRKR